MYRSVLLLSMSFSSVISLIFSLFLLFFLFKNPIRQNNIKQKHNKAAIIGNKGIRSFDFGEGFIGALLWNIIIGGLFKGGVSIDG